MFKIPLVAGLFAVLSLSPAYAAEDLCNDV